MSKSGRSGDATWAGGADVVALRAGAGDAIGEGGSAGVDAGAAEEGTREGRGVDGGTTVATEGAGAGVGIGAGVGRGVAVARGAGTAGCAGAVGDGAAACGTSAGVGAGVATGAPAMATVWGGGEGGRRLSQIAAPSTATPAAATARPRTMEEEVGLAGGVGGRGVAMSSNSEVGGGRPGGQQRPARDLCPAPRNTARPVSIWQIYDPSRTAAILPAQNCGKSALVA